MALLPAVSSCHSPARLEGEKLKNLLCCFKSEPSRFKYWDYSLFVYLAVSLHLFVWIWLLWLEQEKKKKKKNPRGNKTVQQTTKCNRTKYNQTGAMMYMEYLVIAGKASSGKTIFWVLSGSLLHFLMSSQRQETSDLYICVQSFWKSGGLHQTKQTSTVRGLQEEASLQCFSFTLLVCLLSL